MDYSPPGSSFHGILQARILEWFIMLSSRGSSWPRDETCVSYVSYTGRQVLYHSCHRGNTFWFKDTHFSYPKADQVFRQVLSWGGRELYLTWGRNCTELMERSAALLHGTFLRTPQKAHSVWYFFMHQPRAASVFVTIWNLHSWEFVLKKNTVLQIQN